MSGGDPLGWVGSTLDDRVAVEELVGEGGFGYVYRGRHLGFDLPVALKCLKIPATLAEAERTTFLRDFRKEARLLHKLSSKTASIVQALDVGAATSPAGAWSPYIVMEWLEGRTLEQEMMARAGRGRARTTIQQAVQLLGPAANALAVAHGSGIAHLDIKPANLFLVQDDGGVTIKILDFGIAKILSTNKTLTRALTQQGANMSAFTPGYAAPEQFNVRHGKPGAHTDVFSLALIFIELVGGGEALEGDTPLQLYIAAANEQLRPSLASRGVEAPAALEAALRRALEVDPSKRFSDAGSMWSAVVAALPGEAAALGEPARPVRISLAPPGVSSVRAVRTMGAAPTALVPGAGSTGLHRVCTVLIAELVGTAALARRIDPESLGNLVDRVLERLGAMIEQAGGHVEDYVGDRLLATFGLHSDSLAAAQRAVHAALGMPGVLAELPLPRGAIGAGSLRVRAGLSTGKVFLRSSTGASTRRGRISGAPLTVATRLVQEAAAGAVLMGRDTQRQVAGLFAVEPLSVPAAEGETPIKAYRVLGMAREGTRHGIVAEREFHGVSTRLIGRAAELEAAGSAAAEVARDSSARLLTLVGPAGVGRSRLLVETVDQLEADGYLLLGAHASPLHTSSPYSLAASLLRGRFGVHDDDPVEVARDKIERGIRELRSAGVQPAESRSGASAMSRRFGLLAMDPGEIAEQLTRVLGYGIGSETRQDVSADDHSTPIKHRIAAAFAALVHCVQSRVAIVCDDVHWADEASLELVDELLLRCSDQPLLLVCAAQPSLLEWRPQWAEQDGMRQVVEVKPLPSSRMEQVARDRLARVQQLSDALVRQLAERAEGYPLALVEMLHLLVDAAAIEVHDSAPWVLHEERAIGVVALPTSVHGIVQARLDRLDELCRQVLCMAAVIGRTFWDGALVSLGASSRAGLEPALQVLCSRDLIRARVTSSFPEHREYRFSEGATQQVAYEMLGQSERRQMHGAVAAWLVERSSSAGRAALVARHYEKAASLIEALRAYMRAAAHATALGQGAEACRFYERAGRIDAWIAGDTTPEGPTQEIFLGWEPPEDHRVLDWPERTRLRFEHGEVLRRMGQLDQATARYRQALSSIIDVERRTGGTVDRLEPRRWQARIDFRLSLVEEVRGAIEQARSLVERAIAAAEEAELVEERAQMLAHLAGIHQRERDFEASYRVSRQGLRVCRRAARRGEGWNEAVAWLLRTLGGSLLRTDRLVAAERCYLQAARFLDARANPGGVSRVLNNVAAVRFARGELPAARDAFRQVLELADRSGDLWMVMTALSNLGEVEHQLGRHEPAREHLEQAVQLGEQIGARADLAESYRNLALASVAMGDDARAVQAAGRALELVSAPGAELYRPAVHRSVAEICGKLAGGSERAAAIELARELEPLLASEPAEADASTGCRELIAPLLGRGSDSKS